MGEDGSQDWQELCRAAATEPDPKKLMHLIGEIITALDDRDKKTIMASASVGATSRSGRACPGE